MRNIKKNLKQAKRILRRIIRNLKYFWKYDLQEREEELTYLLTDKIIEDCVYELEEDKKLLPNLNILDAEESINLLLNYPKSFCRYGDGEIKIMKGISQAFQTYDKELADGLRRNLIQKRDDIYVGINRAYFHSPINCSAENKRFYRINSYKYRRFFFEVCDPDNLYIDAGCLTAYYRFDDSYDYDKHYSKMIKLFEGKKIALVSGQGVFEKLKFDVFKEAKDKIIIHGPSKNAYSQYNTILNEICEKVPKDYIVCLILGMTAKVMVPDLTDRGYIAWDVGHLAKDYNAYKSKKEKSQKNIDDFWAPD